MKFFMSIYFKLLYVDNHSKDLLAEINFLVWRPYLQLPTKKCRADLYVFQMHLNFVDLYLNIFRQS